MSIKLYPIEKEYEKNEELKKDDVLALKGWMDKQEHLPKISGKKLNFVLQ